MNIDVLESWMPAKDMIATISDDVSWDVVSKIHDAAKGAGVQQIYWPKKKQ